ncbi:MAG: branched-chain amino acid ABC transporter permease [Thermodesulfobacteriota bacterium]
MSRSNRSKLGLWAPLILFLVFVAVFPLLAPNMYFMNVAAFVGIYVLGCTGLNLLMGYAGQLSLGHAAFMGLGAYISGVLTAKFGWPPLPALAASVSGTSLVALVVGFPTLKLKGHYLAMATLGVGIIVYICFVQMDSLTGGPSGLVNVPSFSVGPLSIATPRANHYFIWGLTALGLIGAYNLADSRSGRALKAINTSEIAAATMGVDTFAYKLAIFVVSAAYAAVAGSLYVHYMNFTAPETFSFMHSVMLLTMVVMGGIGEFWGPVLGASLLTILPEYLRAYEGLEVLLYGLILAVVMMFMPKGLAPLLRNLTAILTRKAVVEDEN